MVNFGVICIIIYMVIGCAYCINIMIIAQVFGAKHVLSVRGCQINHITRLLDRTLLFLESHGKEKKIEHILITKVEQQYEAKKCKCKIGYFSR